MMTNEILTFNKNKWKCDHSAQCFASLLVINRFLDSSRFCKDTREVRIFLWQGQNYFLLKYKKSFTFHLNGLASSKGEREKTRGPSLYIASEAVVKARTSYPAKVVATDQGLIKQHMHQPPSPLPRQTASAEAYLTVFPVTKGGHRTTRTTPGSHTTNQISNPCL